MLTNYVEIEANGKVAKAYYSLENLYRIEKTGISLTKLAIETVNAPPSLTETREILMEALRADMPSLEERKEFVNEFINEKRFLAAITTQTFIHKALTAPESDDGDDASEKKLVAA